MVQYPVRWTGQNVLHISPIRYNIINAYTNSTYVVNSKPSCYSYAKANHFITVRCTFRQLCQKLANKTAETFDKVNKNIRFPVCDLLYCFILTNVHSSSKDLKYLLFYRKIILYSINYIIYNPTSCRLKERLFIYIIWPLSVNFNYSTRIYYIYNVCWTVDIQRHTTVNI